MTLWQSILLGIVQGATEFLPISSSGHLVIIPYLVGWQLAPEEAFIFNVLVQVATLLAVIAYFWDDLVGIAIAVLRGLQARQPLRDPQSRLGWYLIAATLPAGVAGMVLKPAVESAFHSPLEAALFLLGTAALLVIAECLGRRQRDLAGLKIVDAVWIGLFQVLALFPGISRSGATITAGMTRDLDRTSAARFSFLMSVPILLAAGLSAFLDLLQMPNLAGVLPTFVGGFLAAAVVGYLSIRWLIGYLTRRPLFLFAAYCAMLSGVTLLLLALHR